MSEETNTKYLTGLSQKVIRAAEPYHTVDELKAAGYSRGEDGAIAVISGIALSTLGGSIAVLAGEKHQKAFHAGQAIWGAGLTLAAMGAKMWQDGSFMEAASEEIKKAMSSE